MSRAQATDFLHVFRYRIICIDAVARITGGFSNVTLPEQDVEAIEYSEGTRTYSLYQAGRSKFTTCTLSHGVAAAGTDFAKWIRNCAEGRDYRLDFEIQLLTRDDIAAAKATIDLTNVKTITGKSIRLFNCMPIRFKPGSDLDALSSDIMIEEIEVQPERMVIINPGPEEILPD